MSGKFHRVGYAFAAFVFALVVGLPAAVAMATAPETLYVGNNSDLDGDDQYTSSQIPIGFTFNFYGVDYTNVDVSTNGAVMFDNPTDEYSNNTLPTSTFGAAALPFWDDLYTGPAKSIYYYTAGSPGSREFIVQWTSTAFCCDLDAPMGTFQAIFYEGTNKVQFQYRNLVGDSRARADDATIGIQKDASTANQFSSDTESIHQGDAISFTPDGDGGYTDNGHADTYDPVYLHLTGSPEAATLTGPTDGATDVSLNPTFTWTAGNLATGYNLAVSNDAAFTDIEFSESDLTSTTYNDFANSLTNGTTYYWRVTSTNDVAYAYSDVHSFTTTALPNQTPDEPTTVGPTELSTSLSVDPTTLLKTPFTFNLTDPDGSDQVGYEVRISTSSDPDDPNVIDYMSVLGGQGARSFKYGQGGTYTNGAASTHLVDGQNYYVYIRTIDAHGAASDWYDVGDGDPSFVYNGTPTEDSDGTTTAVEDTAPNSGDANDDGFLDSWQANVTSLVDPVTSAYSVLQTTGCDVNGSVSVAAAPTGSGADSYNYPAGLMNFTITCANPGDTATITQYFYGISATGLVARKYNPTTHAYTTIPGAVISTVNIGGQSVVRVVYDVTDGGLLDQDGTANGVIVDPSGPALPNNITAPNTGLRHKSLLPYALSFLAGAWLLAQDARRRSIRRKM